MSTSMQADAAVKECHEEGRGGGCTLHDGDVDVLSGERAGWR